MIEMRYTSAVFAALLLVGCGEAQLSPQEERAAFNLDIVWDTADPQTKVDLCILWAEDEEVFIDIMRGVNDNTGTQDVTARVITEHFDEVCP